MKSKVLALAGDSEPTTGSVLVEVEGTQPLSIVVETQSRQLRQWASY